MYRFHVVHAIFWRNFKQYFTNELGYLFIFVFVTCSALLTFSQQFFADNLATLDQLSKFFPFLLLFFIPAITMTVWADEKKQGTDAILFTLPASDFEILMGKFKAVVGVYTVALLFSGTTLLALWRLGSPDWGVVGATYLGYWFAGVALCSIGMFASSLTGNTTVAFVIGTVLCAIPVLLSSIVEGNPRLEFYGVAGQLRDFTLGLISLPGVVYFLTITGFMLYLNYVVITRRHWSRGRQVTLAGHFIARVLALGVVLFSLNVLAEKSSAAFNNRLDLTSESLFTLDTTTKDALAKAAEKERPITIQAFLSPNMPRNYVNTRKNLVGLLRQYDRLGGSNVDVRFVDVQPNSKQVEEALSLQLEKRPSRDTVGGRVVEQDVFMGVVVTSTYDEVVLPFIESDTSIEYQLTRSIATATSEQQRLKLGILKTDAHFDNVQFEGREFDWIAPLTLKELKKQYELISVTADELAGFLKSGEDETDDAVATDETDATEEDSDSKLDVLLVADPSSLTMVGLFNLTQYIQEGNPTLILADPLPFYRATYEAPLVLGVINAPSQARIMAQSGWSPLATSAEPKAFGGSALSLMESLGIRWNHQNTVWTAFDPHVGFKPNLPERFGDRWPDEYGPKQNLFVFAKSYGDHQAFSAASPISSGLHELLFFYPGSLGPKKVKEGAPPPTTKFEPLVTLKPGSAGHLGWDELTEDLVSVRLEMNPYTGETKKVSGPETSRYTGHNIRTIRKRPVLNRPNLLSGSTQDDSTNSDAKDENEEETENRSALDKEAHVLAAHITGIADNKTNVVFIADVDFVSDLFYLQKEAIETPLDNYSFLANAIETLAGDESLVRLRNRRPTPRTLQTIEQMKEPFKLKSVEERDKAEAEVALKLATAQERAEEKAKKLNEDTEMSALERQSQLMFSNVNEGIRLGRQEEKIQQELEDRLTSIKGEEERESKKVEWWVRRLAVFGAGLPALFIGSLVFLYRTIREQSQIDPRRRVNGSSE